MRISCAFAPSPESVEHIVEAERLGYAILGVADHVVAPVSTSVRYPYTADGVWPGAPTSTSLRPSRRTASRS